jgi:hypothetical protein
MQQIENEFAWDMRRFDAMDEQERMMLADRLNREMARLERELGDAAFETQFAIKLANTEALKELVDRDPYRWARLVRAIGGIDPGTHGLNNIATGAGVIGSIFGRR